ncbi:MAG TPA: D-alanyl-D-alanine carboxypeptidase/D-alanyl-D-alanine-endopeptidase [Bacteroidota bacterium]
MTFLNSIFHSHFCVVFALGFIFMSCTSSSRVTVTHTSPVGTSLSSSPYPTIKDGIDALLPDSLFPPANIGIKVLSLRTGETLYELNPDHLFNPASNQKLFTAATALVTLGPTYSFRTEASYDTSIIPTIFIRGSGDPVLSVMDLDTLCLQIASIIPERSSWRLVGDVSLFDDLFMGTGWSWDDESSTYSMGISPLTVNGNSIEVLLKNINGALKLSTKPESDYMTLSINVMIVDSVTERVKIERSWMERTNAVVARGQIGRSDTLVTTELSVYQPERFFMTLVADRLRQQNIPVDEIMIDTVQGNTMPLAVLSHDLDTAITYMNKVSDNLSAENILKTIAAEKVGKPGSAEAGAVIVRTFLQSIGVDTNKIIVADGSGLSRYNLTSANTILALLQAMFTNPECFEEFYNSLPIAGVDGTLDYRMKGTTAEGNLRAKTGTISGASALSGYVHSGDGEPLAFSILTQHYPVGARAYRKVQDAIAVFLSSLRRQSM